MELEWQQISRLALIYVHLMLCVFALQAVLSNDWKVLQRKLLADELAVLHTRVSWLLSGLWMTGLAIVAIDTGFDPEQLSIKPKIQAKLVTVGVLTANALVLKHWCFPRITRLGQLGRRECLCVMVAGATSTTSWLMAPFLGTAKPLADAPLSLLLGLYGLALTGAIVVTLALGSWWHRQTMAVARA